MKKLKLEMELMARKMKKMTIRSKMAGLLLTRSLNRGTFRVLILIQK